MSDGNFNRSLLPSNSYQSGVRAGRAQMRHIALDAFSKWVETRFPELDEEERAQMGAEFRKLI